MAAADIQEDETHRTNTYKPLMHNICLILQSNPEHVAEPNIHTGEMDSMSQMQ